MGFRQTKEHVKGKKSYHQVGVFLGQLRGEKESFDQLVTEVAAAGADGIEIDSWKFDLARADTPEGAARLAAELLEGTRSHGLSIFSVAAHLQGQVLGDEPGAETLQFLGGEPLEAYVEWRRSHSPPRGNPYYVPPEVGELMHKEAARQLSAAGRLAWHLGQMQNRIVPVSGFVGAPANLWRHWFPFPPLPTMLGSVSLFDSGTLVEHSYELLLERFCPVWEHYRVYGSSQGKPRSEVPFALEAHPTEIAMGDLVSAARFLEEVESDHVGFNFDPSHMVWQDIDPVEFIREFHQSIFSAHIKGVTNRAVRKGSTRAGRLGGFLPFGRMERSMDFVMAGTSQDICPWGEIIEALNKYGYDGALTIECEDTALGLLSALPSAVARVQALDLPPSRVAFDAAFAQ